jgi:hypothetical protein
MYKSIKGHQFNSQITVPVGLPLAAVGVVVPLRNIVDPAMGGNQSLLDGASKHGSRDDIKLC